MHYLKEQESQQSRGVLLGIKANTFTHCLGGVNINLRDGAFYFEIYGKAQLRLESNQQ